MARKFLVAANHKMNGNIQSMKQLIQVINNASLDPDTETILAPPSVYLLSARELLKQGIEVSAQNVSDKTSGAFTGEISASQAKDVGATWTILGHSERRQLFHETDELVASKTKTALESGLGVILCCGESLEERESGKTIDVVQRQLKAVIDQVKDWSNVVIAYEPIWAIGTGKVATTQQAQEVHAATRKWLAEAISGSVAENIRILYGGSVNENNCSELAKQADIDGFLVGGASLKPTFCDIINAHKA